MKKVALSLLVVAASGAYVWSHPGGGAADDPLALASESSDPASGLGDQSPIDALRPAPPAPAPATTSALPAPAARNDPPGEAEETRKTEAADARSETGDLLSTRPPVQTLPLPSFLLAPPQAQAAPLERAPAPPVPTPSETAAAAEEPSRPAPSQAAPSEMVALAQMQSPAPDPRRRRRPRRSWRRACRVRGPIITPRW